jgi:hypothetical protein
VKISYYLKHLLIESNGDIAKAYARLYPQYKDSAGGRLRLLGKLTGMHIAGAFRPKRRRFTLTGQMSRHTADMYKKIAQGKAQGQTPAYDYGFLCGGIFVVGFCNFIRQNRQGKILFLSRDGSILREIYLRHCVNSDQGESAETETAYVPWSRAICDHISANADSLAGAKAYYSRIITDQIAVALVDVGWSATSVLALRNLLLQINPELKIQVLLAGLSGEDHGRLLGEGILRTYLFDITHNRADYEHHMFSHAVLIHHVLFEMFTQAEEPCPTDFSPEGKPQYSEDPALVINAPYIRDIRRGIIDFCASYGAECSSDSHMMNISGQDAYQPYRRQSEDLRFFRKNFGDYLIERTPGEFVALKDEFDISGL